ncbi:MAG: hypothetical protein ACHQ03_04525 [Candidatus Bathyarchaeia archaeon]
MIDAINENWITIALAIKSEFFSLDRAYEAINEVEELVMTQPPIPWRERGRSDRISDLRYERILELEADLDSGNPRTKARAETILGINDSSEHA